MYQPVSQQSYLYTCVCMPVHVTQKTKPRLAINNLCPTTATIMHNACIVNNLVSRVWGVIMGTQKKTFKHVESWIE